MKTTLEKNIVVNNIPEKGLDVSVEFDQEQLDEINEIRIPDEFTIKSFKSDLYFKYLPGGDNILRLSGEISFNVETTCGVSLEPMDIDIAEKVEVDFSETIKTDEQVDETYLLPELIENGKIDVYDIVIQELILSLPSYTVKENADISSLNYKPSKLDLELAETKTENPFAKLKDLGASND